MKLDATKFGLSAAMIAAISWSICSLLVFASPASMMTMSGHMMHANFAHMNWTLTSTGFFVGLFAWAGFTGVIVWAFAALYNRLLG